MIDKNYTLPVIEVNEDIPMVILQGDHPGLILSINSHFQTLGLEVLVATNSDTLPFLNDLPTVNPKELPHLTNLTFDYLVSIDPTTSDLALLSPLLDQLLVNNGKAVFIFTHTQSIKEIESQLQAQHPNLDYRLITTYHLFGDLPSSNTGSPLESLLISSVLNNQLSLAQNLDQVLYPTSYQSIAQAVSKALFKTGSFQKKYYLASLEKVSLETLLLEFKRYLPDLDVNYDLSVKSILEPPIKKIISSQADLNWYPYFDHPKDTAQILTNFINSKNLYHQLPDSDSNRSQIPTVNITSTRSTSSSDNFGSSSVDHPTPPSPQNVFVPYTYSKPSYSDLDSDREVTSSIDRSNPQPSSDSDTRPLFTPHIHEHSLQDSNSTRVEKSFEISKPVSSTNAYQARKSSAPKIKTLSSFGKQKGREESKKKIPSISIQHKDQRRFGVSKRGLAVSLILIVFMAIIFGPFGFSIYSAYQAVTAMNKGYQSLLSTSPEDSQDYFVSADQNLNYARAGLTAFLPTKIVFSQKVDKYDRLLDSATRVNSLLKNQARLLKNYQDLYEHILTRDISSTDFDSLKDALLEDSQESYNQLVNTQINLDRQDFDSSFPFLQSLNSYKQLLTKSKNIYHKGISLFKVITAFFGQKNIQNILVVVQNDTELRPTGGFLDTVGVLTVKDGQIIDYSVQDIYSLDQQLKGFVTPPDSLKKYLGEPSWFLRDSNWEPNLPQSAKEIIWFYEKESNRVVDGIIFIDTTTLSKISEVVGPINLEGWDDPINSLNLKEKVLFEPRSQSKEGQQQYLLTQYLKSAIDSLIAQGKSKAVILATTLVDTASESHIQFYHKDPQIQSQISQENLSGELTYEPCFPKFQTISCINETFGIFEANVGINKVNYYMKRSIDHQVIVENTGVINHKITLTYQNTSPSSTWPGGDYKAFIRFYSPLGSDISYVKQDGVLVGLESQRAASVFSFLETSYPIKVAAGATSQIEIALRSPKIINPLSPQNAISISWQKQSGTNSDPLRISLNYPDFFTATEVNQNSNSSPGRTQFLTQFQTDSLFAVSLQKKP